MDHICKYCKKKFFKYNKNAIYCSRDCKHKEQGSKVTDGLLKYYKTEEYKNEKSQRYLKIAKKREVRLNENELILLNKYLDEKYIRDLIILSNKITKRVSYKAILNEFKYNTDLKNKYALTIPALPKHIQNFSLQEWEEIKILIISCQLLKLREKFNIGEKTYSRIRKVIVDKSQQEYIDLKESEPERIVRMVLIELGFSFKREVYVNSNKWRVDFIVKDVVIEVQGDYWHVNPRINFKKINSVQLKNQLNDEKKKNWLLLNNYRVLEIWEMDIYKDLNKIKKIIYEFITTNNSKRFFSTSF